jgi:hypothetical protein
MLTMDNRLQCPTRPILVSDGSNVIDSRVKIRVVDRNVSPRLLLSLVTF